MAKAHKQGFFMQDFELVGAGGVKQDGTRIIVACVSTLTCKRVCLLGGSGGMPHLKKLEFRSSQIASEAIWDKNTCDKTIISISRFLGENCGWGRNSSHPPLCMKP